MKTIAKILLMSLAVALMVMLMVEAQKNDDVKKPVCGRNEEYSTCMNNCPLTCANRHNHRACIQVCLKKGCQCKNGYLKNRRGICVLEKNCS